MDWFNKKNLIFAYHPVYCFQLNFFMGVCMELYSVCLAENSVDNLGIFLLMLGRACTKLSPFLLLSPPVRRLRVHNKLGGDTAGTGNSNC